MHQKTAYEFTVTAIDGSPLALHQFIGKPLLLVNVASKCGLTPQYAALQTLYDEFRDDGLIIIGFPCNQFKEQEPGTETDIESFCRLNYGVTFPLARKIDVNGPHQDPLYAWLTNDAAAFPGKISWNFEKFLINRNGVVANRFDPRTPPDAAEVLEAVEAVLRP